MKKVLLFPGAFNPPHLNHVRTLEFAVSNYLFDEVWIMPSGKRNDKTISTSYEDRRNLNKLFVIYLQSNIAIPIKLITAELDDKSSRFTEEIIEEVKSQPETDITQLIGLDGYLTIEKKLTSKHEKFLVIPRSGYVFQKDLVFDSNITLLSEDPGNGVSSTDIRLMIENEDKKYKELIPKDIADYIEKHNLYANSKITS